MGGTHSFGVLSLLSACRTRNLTGLQTPKLPLLEAMSLRLLLSLAQIKLPSLHGDLRDLFVDGQYWGGWTLSGGINCPGSVFQLRLC